MSSALDVLPRSQHKTVQIVVPEGISLTLELPSIGERLAAFALDVFACVIGLLPIAVLTLLTGADAGEELLMVCIFLLRNCYFIFFETRMGGVTPGKRVVGLCVIDQSGSKLTPQVLLVRNVMREVEFFVPMQLLMAGDWLYSAWEVIPVVCWLGFFTAFPVFNNKHLRVGDFVAGTLVILVPRNLLLPDLARPDIQCAFSDAQLKMYGEEELHVLDHVLRMEASEATAALRADVARRIRDKIKFVPAIGDVDTFLADFYTAQRAFLERRRQLGKEKKNKHE